MSEKTIGTLSKFTGIPAHTIKYYEKIGLLPPTGRRFQLPVLRHADLYGHLRVCEIQKYGLSPEGDKGAGQEAATGGWMSSGERESQIEEEIRALQSRREGWRFSGGDPGAGGRLGKWYIEECGDFYFRSQTKELDYDGGDYLEADGLNLSTLLPVSKTTVHMERSTCGGKKGYSWGMGIFPGRTEWIREGRLPLCPGRQSLCDLSEDHRPLCVGRDHGGGDRPLQTVWPGTPGGLWIRLKITFDENGNDWNYFKIFIPLEEK